MSFLSKFSISLIYPYKFHSKSLSTVIVVINTLTFKENKLINTNCTKKIVNVTIHP